jgi:hypothetical protein
MRIPAREYEKGIAMRVPAHKNGAKGMGLGTPSASRQNGEKAARSPRTEEVNRAARIPGKPHTRPMTAANFTSPKPRPRVPSATQKKRTKANRDAARKNGTVRGECHKRTANIRRKQDAESISGIRRVLISIIEIGREKAEKMINGSKKYF